MLVIDRVVLQRIEEAHEIVRFGNEHAVGSQHFLDGVDDRMHVLDMGKTVGGGDQCGRAVLALDLARHLGPEIALEGGNAALVGDGADVGRLDAERAVAGVLEIRQPISTTRSSFPSPSIAAASRARSAKLSRSSFVVPLV
jgi:hypothetical protein